MTGHAQNSDRTDHDRIKDAARNWLVRLSMAEPSADERAAFQAWCQADPRHAEAYAQIERIWNEVPEADALRDPALLAEVTLGERLAARAQALMRPALAVGGVAVAALVLVAVFLGPGVVPVREPDFATQIAEIRDVPLPDGSVVTLGARSAIDVAFTDQERHVTLAAGQAFFAVERDASRPFVVTVGETRVRVVGTKFDVRRGEATVQVAVLEGVVEVSHEPDDAAAGQVTAEPRRVVTAGQEVVASLAGAMAPARQIKVAEPGAWRQGRLVYVDTTLREVVADANRYSKARIEFADEAVGDLMISATFRAGEIDQVVASLTRILPIQAEHPAPDRIVLSARAGGG